MATHLYARVEPTGRINSGWVVVVANPDSGDPPIRMSVPASDLLPLTASDYAAAGRKHTELKTSRLSDEEQGQAIIDAAFQGG